MARKSRATESREDVRTKARAALGIEPGDAGSSEPLRALFSRTGAAWYPLVSLGSRQRPFGAVNRTSQL